MCQPQQYEEKLKKNLAGNRLNIYQNHKKMKKITVFYNNIFHSDYLN